MAQLRSPSPHTLTHSGAAPEQPPTMLRAATGTLELELPQAGGQLVVGTNGSCDLVLRDPYASSRHCSLERRGKGPWLVRDQRSKNGTLLDGCRIHAAELTLGSRLCVGRTQFLAVADHSAATSARQRLIGQTPRFCSAVTHALRAARSDCSILILGETGTGKELFARAIHEASRRSSQPFVAVNCGGIPHDLVSSELFGHVRGSFTGATQDHEGFFRQAQSGTLFLDELGELPMAQQPHLLRALETRLIRPVGARLEHMIDTRVVAATNRLHLHGTQSPLRADLYHRLATLVIDLPPLRERADDIPLLVRAFLDEMAAEHGARELSESIMAELSRHQWLGNIRELRNAVTRAVTLGGSRLRLEDFLPGGVVPSGGADASGCSSERSGARRGLSPYQQRQRQILAEAYARHGTIRRAAEDIGIAKSTFADLCRRLGIDTSRVRSSA